MNDEENVIARWSRLKREAAEGKKARTEAPSQQRHEARAEQVDKEVPAAPVVARPGPEPPFDPATLPPVDSIVAGSDIRAFLQKGVPAELTKAALRRAWTTDPAIRDFIGIAENQWDFTDPTAMPGFGPLEATGEIPRLVAESMKVSEERASGAPGLAQESRRATPEAEAGAPPPPTADKTDAGKNETDADKSTVAVAASQHPAPPSDGGTATRRQGHGGAMPR